MLFLSERNSMKNLLLICALLISFGCSSPKPNYQNPYPERVLINDDTGKPVERPSWGDK